MNAPAPTFRPFAWRLRAATLWALFWAAIGSCTALWADEPAPTYTVRRGDTLERIAQQHYPDSPLQATAIVRELRALNAQALGETPPRKRLKVGLSLHVPSHESMVKRVLAPYVVQEQAERAQAQQEQERRRWVRYP